MALFPGCFWIGLVLKLHLQSTLYSIFKSYIVCTQKRSGEKLLESVGPPLAPPLLSAAKPGGS